MKSVLVLLKLRLGYEIYACVIKATLGLCNLCLLLKLGLTCEICACVIKATLGL